MRRSALVCAVLGVLAMPVWGDGFHQPPFQRIKPDIWEKKMREKLRIPKKTKKVQITGKDPKEVPVPDDTPKKPPLTTEELGGVIVHLIDLLRYLDPVNISQSEFPEIWRNIKAYREKVCVLLSDLGPKAVGYLVEALINELRARRKGEGRRVPKELLGRRRADRNTWGTTGDSEMLPAPTYVDDLVDVLRMIGWDALREALRRQGAARDDKVREDLGRVLDTTARKWPRLFRKGLKDKDDAVRRSTQTLLGRVLGGKWGTDRDLSTTLIHSLVDDLRALDEKSRTHALARLRTLTKQDFARDQVQWRSWWASSIPVWAWGGVRAVPELIERLADEEPLGRVVAARHLKKLCGTDCGRKTKWWAAADAEGIAKAQQKWRAWWRKNGVALIRKAEKKAGKKR